MAAGDDYFGVWGYSVYIYDISLIIVKKSAACGNFIYGGSFGTNKEFVGVSWTVSQNGYRGR